MFANRYASQDKTRRPSHTETTQAERNQPSTTERQQRLYRMMKNQGIDTRLERNKTPDVEIRWLG